MSDARALLRVLDEAPAAVALNRGPELRYELVNPLYRRLLGNVELVGKPLAEVLPDWAQLRIILERVRDTGAPFTAREHRFLVDPNGTGELVDAWFDVICEPLLEPDGTIGGVITFGLDVSDQVRARHRIETTAAELQRAVDARDAFLSVASHELKTPLTALHLQVQALRRGLARADERQYSPEQLRARLDAADRQVNRLVELIDSLLDVSRLAKGPLDLAAAEVDLAAIAAEVAERARPAAAAAGSTLTVHAPAPVRGSFDASRVDQVVTNLVANAIKYGNGQPIDVRVEIERGTDRARACVAVIDRGIGIALEDQQRIFDRFERAVSRTHYAGLGLGLWISRQIAHALGGDISVESAPGQGARFVLRLPI